jgi:hypothetical protein
LEDERKKEEKRLNILIDHLKERTEDLDQLEVEFGQEERILEKEITSLKIHLEEEMKIEEVMKSQMMRKEEEVKKIEEEVVTLRAKIVKIRRMRKIVRVMKKYSKEGIMFN